MYTRRQLQNQQMILKAHGYYNGACDGIWSKQSITAKQRFERDKTFKPAYPNNGMPFDVTGGSKFPVGVSIDYKRRGMLTSEKLTDEKVTEWTGQLVEDYDVRKQSAMPVQEEPKPVEPVSETKPEPEKVSEPETEEAKAQPVNETKQTNHSNNRQQQHRKKQRHGNNQR